MREQRKSKATWMAVAMLGMSSLLASAALAQSAGEERRYPLADRGTLVLKVPADWNERVGRRDAKTPPTILFTPKSGPRFNVLVTPIWPMQPGMAAPAAEELRKGVASASEAVKSQAVESSLPVLELKGPAARGYYFRATDKAPKPGEFKYMAQGMLGLGELRVTFTILTNDGQDAVARTALEMLRNAAIHQMEETRRR